MKCNKFRKNTFEELEKVKKLVSGKFPDFDFRNLTKVLSRLGTYHYNKRGSMILGEERKMYNLLIENSYNPFTVYRWALLEKVPEDIRFQLKNSSIGQKKASRFASERKHETSSTLALSIKEMGIMLIRRM